MTLEAPAVPSTAGTPASGRSLVTELPGPRSRELQAARERAVPRGFGVVLPVFVDHADGALLVDVDGNRLIDMASGIAVTSVGAAAPEVANAVGEQAARFTHTCFMVTEYAGFVRVAEALNRLTPGDHPKRTALFSTGAEAVENAVKIARAHTGRPAVVVLDHAYHGRTLMTMSMTAKNVPYKEGFGPFAPEVYRVPTAYPYRWPGGAERAAEEALAALEEIVLTQVGAHNVACIVAEPISGEGGFIVPAEGFLPGVAEFAHRHGIVFIADEIQTGFGRTGAMFASEHEGLVPDLVTTAKALAGGMPLSAVTGRAEIMDAVEPGGIGGTYAGNPVACAAALAAIDLIEREDLPARARGIEALVLPRLHALVAPASVGGRRPRSWRHAGHRVRPARHHHARPVRRQVRRGHRQRAGCPHPHLRHVRQRDPAAAAAGDHRRPAGGRALRDRGRRRRTVGPMSGVSYDVRTGDVVAHVADSTAEQVRDVVARAAGAAPAVAAATPAERRRWLVAVADALVDPRTAAELLRVADRETALGQARLTGEIVRCADQLRFYGDVAAEASFLRAAVDHPTATAPDLRRMQVPLGPVAVLGASNFPFAFGALGNDTGSALAAGCPVVAKAHPAHPETSALLAAVATDALATAGAPDGAFGLIAGFEAGEALVRLAGDRRRRVHGLPAGRARAVAARQPARPWSSPCTPRWAR